MQRQSNIWRWKTVLIFILLYILWHLRSSRRPGAWDCICANRRSDKTSPSNQRKHSQYAISLIEGIDQRIWPNRCFQLSGRDRSDYERYYMKLCIKDGTSKEEITRLHPRYEELCSSKFPSGPFGQLCTQTIIFFQSTRWTRHFCRE